MPPPSHYARLGIEPTASPEEIRRAFRAAVKKLPPMDASEEWRRVLEAYAVLRDPVARRRYDARCRGRAWGLQIAARLPPHRGSPSRLRLILRLGLATSGWVVERLIARRDGAEERTRMRSPLAALPNGRGTAIILLDAFVNEVQRAMATKAPPETLARNLSALLTRYRKEAAAQLRNLELVTMQMNDRCPNGNLEALALRVIWGTGVDRSGREGQAPET